MATDSQELAGLMDQFDFTMSSLSGVSIHAGSRPPSHAGEIHETTRNKTSRPLDAAKVHTMQRTKVVFTRWY